MVINPCNGIIAWVMTQNGKNHKPVKNLNTPLEQQLAFDFTLTEKGQRAIGSKHSVWMNWSLWLSPRIIRPLAPHKKAHFSALQQIRPAYIQTVKPSESDPSNRAWKLGFSISIEKNTEKNYVDVAYFNTQISL